MKNLMVLGVLISLISLLTGCLVPLRFDPDKVISEKRDVAPFDKIRFDGHAKLIIEQGDSSSLTVVANPELMSRLSSSVTNNRLFLEVGRMSFGNRSVIWPSIKFIVTVKDLSELEVESHGELEIQSLDVEQLSLEVDSHFEFNIGSLKAKSLTVEVDSHSDGEIGEIVVEEGPFLLEVESHSDLEVGSIKAPSATFRFEGHADGHLKNVHLSNLEVEVQGHSDLMISGKVEFQKVVVENHGSYDGTRLKSDLTSITAKDHGDAYVSSKTLKDINVSDHGTIKNNP